MLSLLLVACVLSLSSCQQSSLTPLMPGTFISGDIYPNAKADLKAYNAVWYDPSEDTGELSSVYLELLLKISASVAGHYISFSPLRGGQGLQLSFEGQTLDLRVDQETLSTQWTEGLVMRTSTTVTGENRIRVRNTVEDIGVEETQDLHFKQNGLEVCLMFTLTMFQC